ncbi:hypothetical protein [Arthrobacter globiformis]|uniref:hypothetical protein n=1 Tax=Arthrobacter globiformis TaxID=1665 RepID=UPI0027885E50|nr:hypothetical protein [Arthrobacter globiformis]MDQ0867402.1 hypothetical protein [Arthrobacter globiformis]
MGTLKPTDTATRNKNPAQAKRILTHLMLAVLVFVAGMLTCAVTSGGTKETVREVPGPVREVPRPSCLQALDHADRTFRTFAKVLRLLQAGDYAAAEAWTQKLAGIPPEYNAAKAACRAGTGRLDELTGVFRSLGSDAPTTFPLGPIICTKGSFFTVPATARLS